MDRLNLGQFVEALAEFDPAKTIQFDFGYFAPSRIHSWRGVYEQVALGYDTSVETTVEFVRGLARGAIGQFFTGYKGGSYLMRPETRLWVSQHDEANHTGIVRVTEHGHHVIINTAWFEDDY